MGANRKGAVKAPFLVPEHQFPTSTQENHHRTSP